jgi:beta-galactosidase
VTTQMFRSLGHAIAWITCVAALAGLSEPAMANDAMFPAQTAAASSISWNYNYFVVKGKPTVVSVGEIHYARVPRELWRERLVKMKRAGFNTVSTYVFWNAQEPTPGVFELTDNLDLDAWLSMIEDVGLYAIVRPGPYNCAEWLAGGIPQWITSKGMQIRDDSADYLAAADGYYEKIIPIIAKHQIHKGGGVLFMQIENEHPAGWGTDANAYLTHLYNKARSLGLEIPLFYSGLHHATDPAGGTPFGNRTYPWFSTEFWSGWFSPPFGEMSASDLNVLTRGAWKVIAFGGSGNSFYVFHGGTNFGYEGDTATTSYDYRAPLGEAGQLRQGYFAVRGPASFSRTFETLMATSQDGGNVATVSSGLKTYVRKSSSDGTAVFLDNQGTASVQTQVKLSSPAIQFPAGNTQITVAANEIRPVVASAHWTANATFAYLATNVLGKLTLETKTYYVFHGRSGEAGEIAVQYGTAPTTAPATPWSWDATSKLARATVNYPTGDNITELLLDSGDGSSATFLVVNTALANRTWFTDKAVYVGGTYIDDDQSIQVPTAGGKVAVYSAAGRSDVSVPAVTAPQVPTIGSWQWRDAAAEAAPGYDDSTWASSAQPLPFGANNFQNGYGWYRAKFTAASAGNVTATLGGVRASAMAFANGKLVTITNNSVSFSTVTGENTLAFLAKHEGLDKVYNVTGSTGTLQYAGIWGSVTSSGSALASSWKFRGGLGQMDETAVVGLVKNWTTFLGGAWAATQTTKSWPALWRASFKSPLQDGVFATVGLRTTGLSTGSVWVNGHNIGRFSGNTLLYVPEGWLTADNTVVIYDASGNAPTSVKLEFIETRARYQTNGTGGAGGAAGTGGTTGSGGASGSPGGTGPVGTGGGPSAGGMRATGGTSTISGTGGSSRGGSGGNVNGGTAGIVSSGVGGNTRADSGGNVSGGASTNSGGGASMIGAVGGGTISTGGGSTTGGAGDNGGSQNVGTSTNGAAGTGLTSIGSDKSSSGCSCRVGTSSRSSEPLLAADLTLVALCLRRRKRR